MAQQHLWAKSHRVTNAAWWYEENYGLYIYHQAHQRYVDMAKPTLVRIPWKAIRAALRRKDKR